MSNYVRITGLIVFYLTCACALLLPFNFLVPQTATFLIFFWLIGMNWNERWINIRSSSSVWLWVALAILYIAGYWWSANKVEALTSLIVKAGIFVFPIVFASLRFDEKKSKRILQSFLSGLVLVGLFMIARAAYYDWTEGLDMWSYQELTKRIMHPSYLGLFYVVGVMICFHGILLRDVPKMRKLVAIVLVVFYCILILMLSSKTALLSLAVVFLFYIGYAVIRFRRYIVAVISLLALIITFVVAINVFPTIGARLHSMTEVISSDKPIDPRDAESNRVRLLIWQVDLDVMKKYPMTGVGTGDVQDTLEHEYALRGMQGAIQHDLNAHNQYFQTGIALGLPGLILLVGILLAALVISIRMQFGFGALLSVLIGFNFIPESMLQMQAGTLFTGFFYSLVLFSIDRKLLSPPTT